MSKQKEKCLAVSISGSDVILVTVVFDTTAKHEIVNDVTWKLRKGAREIAYADMHRRVSTLVRESDFDRIVIKGSDAIGHSASLAILQSAEHRGVVIAAVASAIQNEDLQVKRKSDISRNFGERKVGGYAKDEEYWTRNFSGRLRKGSRETAFLALATLDD
jgi:hypothetical protein